VSETTDLSTRYGWTFSKLARTAFSDMDWGRGARARLGLRLAFLMPASICFSDCFSCLFSQAGCGVLFAREPDGVDAKGLPKGPKMRSA
jgi:hypothetical protein